MKKICYFVIFSKPPFLRMITCVFRYYENAPRTNRGFFILFIIFIVGKMTSPTMRQV